MSLAEHLIELRTRLFRSAIAVFVAAVASYVFYGPIFRVLTHPYCELPVSQRGIPGTGGSVEHCNLYFFHPLDAFTIRIRVAVICGVLLSSPVWLFQLWRFITPGLYRNERRWALAFGGCSTGLFAIGAFFAYITMPKALAFLLGAVGNQATAVLGIDQYLTFITTVLAVFGASFEFPLIVVLLNLAGLVKYKRLASWRRLEIFLVFVFAAVITPSQDPITMTAMAVPLCLLYEVALVVARVHDRRVARRAAASAYAGLSPDEPSPLPDYGPAATSAP